MKQLLPRFLLVFSLLSLFSCTITKRKYTGGYYVNWHSRAPEARVLIPIQSKHTVPGKITQTNSPITKKQVVSQPEETITYKLVQAVNLSRNKREPLKTISDNFISSTYPATPQNEVQGHSIQKHHTPRGLPVLFGLLAILGSLISLMLCLPFYAFPAIGGVLSVLITLVFIILTLSFAKNILRGVKNDPNSRGKGWANLSLFFVVIASLFLIFSVYALIISQ